MGAVSVSSVIVTIFSYIQRLGIAAKLPGINLPESIKNVLVVFVNFYNTLESSFPDIPDLDFRSQLVLLAVGVPVLLDIIFVWFIYPIYDVVMHILDMIGIGAFAYFLTSGIVLGFNSVITVWTVVTAIYIISRVVLMFYGKSKTIDQLFELVQSICSFFMSNIIPQREQTVTFRELNSQILRFSKLIEVVPEKPIYWKSLIWLEIGLVFIIGGFFCLGMFSDPGKLPESVRIILPIFLLPIGFLSWIAFMLQMFPCGRKFIVWFKQFLRRWGLRFLMLALDILYVPIIQCLVYHMTPSKQGCDANYYLYYERKGKSFLDPFINKSVECLPCARKVTGACIELCSGYKELRMKSSPALLFTKDVWGIMGGIVIYTFFIIMFGIPLLWYFLVKRNSGFVKHINVYGTTAEYKWVALTNRLRTTGIFIFEDFKHDKAYWCVLLIIMKLIQMLVEVISEMMWEPFIVALPIYYFISAILTWVFKPYVHTFNTVFEVILEMINAIFSVIATLTYFGLNIPDSWTVPLSVLLLGVPIVSLFFIVCVEDEKGTEDDETDPTFLHKVTAKTVKDDKDLPNIYDADKNDMERLLLQPEHKFNDDLSSLDNSDSHRVPIDPEMAMKGSSSQMAIKDSGSQMAMKGSGSQIGASEKKEDDSVWEYAYCDDEHCIIEFGLLDTIDECLKREDESKISPEEEQPLMAFEVRKTKIAKLMTKMYETLDVVLDGSTIELLTRVLDTVVLIGAAATGWYLGALFANHEKATEVICG
jgi:hypothetical protein